MDEKTSTMVSSPGATKTVTGFIAIREIPLSITDTRTKVAISPESSEALREIMYSPATDAENDIESSPAKVIVAAVA